MSFEDDIKYTDAHIVFKEHPDHVSLLFQVSKCPHRCKNCHTPELQEDIGKHLTLEVLRDYIVKYYNAIGNVIFFGGNQHKEQFVELLKLCKDFGLKTTLWTGDDNIDEDIKMYLNYLKTGLYIEELGALGTPGTNQKYIDLKTGKDIVINA